MIRKLVAALALCALAVSCSKKGGPTTPAPTGPGSIEITSVPGSAAASVIIDNATASAYTPARFDHVASGPAAVDLRMTGYADTTVVLTVPASRIVADTVRMRPLPGTPTTIAEAWAGYFELVGPIAVSPSGTFYVTAYTQPPVLTILAVINSNGAILHQTVIPDVDARPAADIALDSHDDVYVAGDHGHSTIFHFNAGGSLITSFGRRVSSTDDLQGIAIGPGDTLCVSGRYNGAPMIEKYTTGGGFQSAFTAAGAGPLEVGSDGSAYLGVGSTVYRYSAGGVLLGSWAAGGSIQCITRGPGGNLFITSLSDDAVQAPGLIEVFSPTGSRISAWGTEDGSLANFGRPAVDSQGAVYVPLPNDRRVLRYGVN